MIRLILKRLLAALPNLLGVVVITFLLTRALPGDPAAYFAGGAATQEAVEEVRKQLGLDRPLPEQFFRYLENVEAKIVPATMGNDAGIVGAALFAVHGVKALARKRRRAKE